MYKPTIEEIEKGMKTGDTPITYYAKKMYYPQKGGYKSYLSSMVKGLNIELNHEVIKVDLDKKMYIFLMEILKNMMNLYQVFHYLSL